MVLILIIQLCMHNSMFNAGNYFVDEVIKLISAYLSEGTPILLKSHPKQGRVDSREEGGWVLTCIIQIYAPLTQY